MVVFINETRGFITLTIQYGFLVCSVHLLLLLYSVLFGVSESVSDCCLTSTQQFFSYTMARTS
jgi:hypothetical protein